MGADLETSRKRSLMPRVDMPKSAFLSHPAPSSITQSAIKEPTVEISKLEEKN